MHLILPVSRGSESWEDPCKGSSETTPDQGSLPQRPAYPGDLAGERLACWPERGKVFLSWGFLLLLFATTAQSL